MAESSSLFSLEGERIVVTGGAGLLGAFFVETIVSFGGHAIVWDRDEATGQNLINTFDSKSVTFQSVDITSPVDIEAAVQYLVEHALEPTVLVNNAACNPKMEAGSSQWSRMENYSLESWNTELAVGLTGAFLCSQVLGSMFAQKKRGVILNIASDLGIIAPDQRLYEQDGLPATEQMKKPVTYSVVKHGIIGLTKYLATYWAEQGVRVNSISPAGIHAGQDEDFVKRLSSLIPMGRMAEKEDLRGAFVYLCSQASSFVNGHNLVVDGGRTIW